MSAIDQVTAALRALVDRNFTFFSGAMIGADKAITRDEVLVARRALSTYDADQEAAPFGLEAWQVPQPTTAVRDVLAERQRQVDVEGWTEGHDDSEHGDGTALAQAAACYAVADPPWPDRLPIAPAEWPWSVQWWKPKDRRHNLVRAAALILAEIERMDRASARRSSGVGHG